MSILLWALSTANRKLSDVLEVMARPVYDAPAVVTAIMAALRFTEGTQPLMVPSRVANMKSAGEPLMLNCEDPLKTVPVGEPGPSPPAVGINTSKGTLAPLPS